MVFTRVYKIITPFIVNSRYYSVLFVGLKLPLCAMLGTVSPRFNQICFLININCNPMLFCLFCMSLYNIGFHPFVHFVVTVMGRRKLRFDHHKNYEG